MAGTLTVTQAACHIPELWSTKTRDAVEANVIATTLVDQTFMAPLKGGPGDTINIPYISNPTANTKTANTNITLEQIGPSNAEASQSATISTHQHVAFALENITSVQALTNMMAKYTNKAGYALGAAADTNLNTLPQNFSQVEGTLGVEPIEGNWLRASQYLDDALAKGNRFVLVRPATYYAMQKTTRFTNADYAGSANAIKATERNEVGMIFNARVYISTLVRAPSAGQAENWFCDPFGVYFCSQQMKTNSPQFSIERDADVFSATHIYGYAEALQPPVTSGGGTATDVFNVLVRGVS